MKKNKALEKEILINKLLLVGVIVIFVIAFILFFVFNDNGKSNTNANINDNNNTNDVKKKKKSENNLTETKRMDGLEINNIVIDKNDGKITITVDINNVSDKIYPATSLNFVVLDGNNEVLKKIPTKISNINVGEKETITVDVTDCYGDARDFKLEKK